MELKLDSRDVVYDITWVLRWLTRLPQILIFQVLPLRYAHELLPVEKI